MRAVFHCLIAWLLFQAACLAQDMVLTNAAQLRALLPEAATNAVPVHLRAVVNVVGGDFSRTIFIQDDTGGTFISGTRQTRGLEPGSHIEVRGVTYAGLFVPGITATQIVTLGSRPLPAPVPATYDDLVSGRLHYQRVEVQGIVRSAEIITNHCKLRLAMGTRILDVHALERPESGPPPWVDALVTLRGLAAGYINDKRQLVSPQLVMHSLADATVDAPPPSDPFDAPHVGVAQLLNFHPSGVSGHRLKVQGVVSHMQRGSALFLRDAGRGLLARISAGEDVRPGDLVEVAGFPSMGTFSAFLDDAIYRVLGRDASPQPVQTTVQDVLRGVNDADLVTLDAQLLEVLPGSEETGLVLIADDTILRGRVPGTKVSLRNGSQLRLTGVCRVEESTFPGTGFRANPRTVELLLRSPADIAVLAAPSWWTNERLAIAALALLTLSVLAFFWVISLRRRVAEQTRIIRSSIEQAAMLEERQRVAREVHDTLAQSFSAIGFQLEALERRLPPEAASAKSQLDTARQLARHGQEEFRRSLLNLRASELERGGLDQALPELARQIVAGTGLELECSIKGGVRRLPGVVEDNFLRIGQECLNNVVKHAGARRVVVELFYETASIRLRVTDDGRGFDPQQSEVQANGHFGLRGIRERAGQIHATLTVTSEPGKGTVVDILADT